MQPASDLAHGKLMRWLFELLSSSIGKKVLMALTGLFLVSFLVVHLYGNLFLFVSEEAFNEHAHSFASNVIIRTIEALLFMAIVTHSFTGVYLARQNRVARPVRYRRHQAAGTRTLASRSMLLTGSAVFIFLVIHLRGFFYETRFGSVHEGASLYELVTDTFAIPGYAALYVAAMILLAGHLAHGVLSAFRSLGIESARYTPAIRAFSLFLALALPAAFASMPIYFVIQGGGGA